MSRSSYLYQAPNQGIGQQSYSNRMAKERGEAQQRLQSRDNAYDFGPMQPERSALARMADQATMGQPVNLNEAERLQKAALDRQLIDQGLRQKSIDEAIGAPGPRLDALSRGSPGGYKASFAPKEKTQWDPFNNPEMKGMTGMEKRAARFADGGLVYGMGGPGTRDYGMGAPGLRGYAMGGLVEPPLKGGLGQMMPSGKFLRPQRKPDFMIEQGYAMGGPVEGPGGPKDDLINARLSDGEFVLPAEAVEFYGLDRLHKMMAKAKEGLAEIKPAPQAPRSLQMPQPLPMMMGNPMGQPQPTPGFAYGGPVMRNSLPGFNRGGQFDSEETPTDGSPTPADWEKDAYSAYMRSNVNQAIGAQQFATDMNQNPSFLDYYFPEAGVQASERASSATQQATDALGRFFENEAAATAEDLQRMAETRQRQDAMMNYQPGSPAPRPAPGPLPVYGSAAPLFPRGRPVAPSPATAMMAPAVSPSPTPQVTAAPMTFVADPAAKAAMRSRRDEIRAGQPLLTAPEGLLAQGRAVLDSLPPAPAMANGRQPQPVVASPMDTPMMRPSPLTMTEKERQAMPLSRSRTPQANPDFEAALAGLTGMQKRRARAGLQMEEATFNRNQGRADIEQARTDERARQERALNFEEWKQKRVIDSQFDMAARNQAIGENAALGAATTAEARAYEETQNRRKQEEQSKRAKNFTPIPDTDYLINDLGNLISKKTNKAVGLSPEEAEKYGLVIIGADSDGRVRYGPPKVTPVERRYIDPDTNRPFTLKPGEELPAGSLLVPLTPNAAPAPASGATPPVAVKTQDEWKALKPGTRYVDSTGTVSIKK